MDISRKEFIEKFSIISLGFSSLGRVIASNSNLIDNMKYSNLVEDPKGILNLPHGFSYNIISKYKDKMKDGLRVPNAADGMGCFDGGGNNIILVRNHELGHFPIIQNTFRKKSPYGRGISRYLKKNKNKFYDYKGKNTECYGGTTTIVYNMKTEKIIDQHLSLSGTLVNCSGGQTPWGTWISCEETVKKKQGKVYKNHGFNFEVIPLDSNSSNGPLPLKDMGRFRHEAVAFDTNNGFVYQTEDREDGLFYRFIPNVRNDLSSGGKLQALSLENFISSDCSNWKTRNFKVGDSHKVKWVTLDNVESPEDDLRIRGKSKGCASFARGEGMWCDNDNVYFTSTTGGKRKLGQVWRYIIGDNNSDGMLELFFESDNKNLLSMPDNIVVTPWGDLLVSEDGKGHDRLVGIKPDGETYLFAKNIYNNSEFAGAVFSPDKKVLFVNIYKPTMTIAITGPWKNIS
ncbi:DUF839 domain-containing protein [Candidatus Marinimicrobia bacterium]|nr:DUF839 domain-containing protein [Candidatus Neomarinimicrobiota bacterium]